MKKKIDLKSLSLGALLVAIAFVTIAATTAQPFVKEIQPVRFLVLEATPKGEATDFGQPTVLRVSPHYGKIDQKGLNFRFEHETQELKLVIFVERGYEITRGDIIGFQAYQHLKLSPGSAITRHLPSGESENVR